MGKQQKAAVVEEVLLAIPSFNLGVDNAKQMLTKAQLENIKANIMNGIINGTIDYSKDRNNHDEVRSYARSMVDNHLKKAKDLNGGNVYKSSTTTTKSAQPITKDAPKGVDTSILTPELKEIAKTLV